MYSLHSGPSCRRTLLLVAFFAFVLFAIPGFVSASGCGTLPSGISGLMISCIPVNIVNTQSSATPTSFQQMLSGFPTNALQGNFVIYNAISGGLLNAWVESNSIVWVNLGSNIIAASHRTPWPLTCSWTAHGRSWLIIP